MKRSSNFFSLFFFISLSRFFIIDGCPKSNWSDQFAGYIRIVSIYAFSWLFCIVHVYQEGFSELYLMAPIIDFHIDVQKKFDFISVFIIVQALSCQNWPGALCNPEACLSINNCPNFMIH